MKTQLLQGSSFHFNNINWCEQNMSDDLRGGDIHWSRTFGFAINFNGQCIHTSKTFESAKKRLDTLFAKWYLEFTPEEI